jgi:hypothetical protein
MVHFQAPLQQDTASKQRWPMGNHNPMLSQEFAEYSLNCIVLSHRALLSTIDSANYGRTAGVSTGRPRARSIR